MNPDAPQQQPAPTPDTLLNTKQAVPQDIVEAGHNDGIPRDFDSPESLDQEITQGADREHIDPHHSTTYNKTADDTTDFVEDN